MDSDLQVYNIDKVRQYYNLKTLEEINLILKAYFNNGIIFKNIEPVRFNINNQYIIKGTLDCTRFYNSLNILPIELYISYDKQICLKFLDTIILDYTYWKYSKTTSKYRNIFLNSTTDETKKDINKGKILLINLNK